MARTTTQAAAAARMIRKELKAAGIAARVSSKTYSGGNSVRVTLYNPLPATRKAVDRELWKYRMGSFDAMQDMYEYNSRRFDIPQVNYVFIETEYSDDMKQAAWTHLRERFVGWDHCPEKYAELTFSHHNTDNPIEDAQQAVRNVLSGDYDNRCCGTRLLFWATMKPRQRAA